MWQFEQLVSVAAWVNLPPDQLVKVEAALACQVLQSLPLVATWPENDAVPCAPVLPSLLYEPLWQVLHGVLLTDA